MHVLGLTVDCHKGSRYRTSKNVTATSAAVIEKPSEKQDFCNDDREPTFIGVTASPAASNDDGESTTIIGEDTEHVYSSDCGSSNDDGDMEFPIYNISAHLKRVRDLIVLEI
ncbi:uncharacterized protein LOC141900797 [Tubulanus polymorphus]|uniref:uncharacterized protein LOC141900797 n=1 Tax=Tubulanus polymorphus TaxID=672921 RepID=UPI003DA60980